MELKKRIQPSRLRSAALRAGALFVALFTASCSLATLDPDDGSINPQLSIMGLQADVNEVQINITGQDYQRSVTVTPSSSNIEFFLPPGDDVKFSIEAANQDPATSHIYSWGMTRFADLVQGETAELDFVMGPKAAKIFIPDNGSGQLIELRDFDVATDLTNLPVTAYQSRVSDHSRNSG